MRLLRRVQRADQHHLRLDHMGADGPRPAKLEYNQDRVDASCSEEGLVSDHAATDSAQILLSSDWMKLIPISSN